MRPRGQVDRDGPIWVERDRSGRTITLWPSDWSHIQESRGRAFTPDDVREVIRQASCRTGRVESNREEFWLAGQGPSRWLKVVVDFSHDAIVWTAYPERRGPRGRQSE